MRFINTIFVSARNGKFIPELVDMIPQLRTLSGCPQTRESDAETITCSALNHFFGIVGNVNNRAVWTAMLLRDIAMPQCRVLTPKGDIFTGHAHRSAYDSVLLLKGIGFSYDETREIVSLIENHEILSEVKRMDGTFYEKITRLKENYPNLDDLLLVGLCDALAYGSEKKGTVKMCLDLMRHTNNRYYRDAMLYVEHITETVSWENNGWYGIPVSA